MHPIGSDDTVVATDNIDDGLRACFGRRYEEVNVEMIPG